MGTISQGVDDINQIMRQGRLDKERIALQQAQESRLNEQARAAKAKQDEADRLDALNKSADAAGAKVFDGFRAQHILDGGDEQNYNPTPDQMAAAFRARGQEYLKAGDMNGFLKSHAEGAAMRAQVRANVVKDAMASGDPVAVMRAMNTTVDNGVSLADVKPISLPSQDPNSAGQAYKVTYKMPDGSTRDEMVTANDISKRAAYVLANPAEIAKQELAYDLNRQKVQGVMSEQNNKASNDQETHRQELAGRKEIVGLETAGRMKVKGMVSGDARLRHDDEEGDPGLDGIKPRDMIASIDSDRKGIQERRSALFKDYQQGLKDLRPGDRQGAASLSAAYERQVSQLDAENSELNRRREKVADRLGLSSKSSKSTQSNGQGLSSKATSATKPTTTVTNW